MKTIGEIDVGDVIEIKYGGELRKLEVIKYLISQHDDATKLGCYIIEERQFESIYNLNVKRIIYKEEK